MNLGKRPSTVRRTAALAGVIVAVLVASVGVVARAPGRLSADNITSGVGGEISIGTPTLVSGTLRVPILGSMATNPYSAVNVGLTFDGMLLSFASVDSTGSAVPSPILCVSDAMPGGETVGCSTVGTGSTVNGGLLLTVVLTPEATAGCTSLHLVTLNAPDNGGPNFGTYTVNAADELPQRNTYGPDVTVDTATGATGCAVAPPTATSTSTATATATETATLIPSATATPTTTVFPVRTSTPEETVPSGRCLTRGGKVRLLVGITKRLGSARGEHRYSAKFDVNGDGSISLADAIQVLLTPTCSR